MGQTGAADNTGDKLLANSACTESAGDGGTSLQREMRGVRMMPILNMIIVLIVILILVDSKYCHSAMCRIVGCVPECDADGPRVAGPLNYRANPSLKPGIPTYLRSKICGYR